MGRPALNLGGRRFGKLVATNTLRIAAGNNRQRLCYCDCGNETWLGTTNLTTGHTQSCGCWLMEFKSLPSGQAARNEVFSGYKSDAKRRGLEWNLTDEQFDAVVSQCCFYCGLEPSNRNSVNRNGGRKNRLSSGDFVYSGIDRVNNNLGYHADNIVACCKICNKAKSNMSLSDFLEWINRIKQHDIVC